MSDANGERDIFEYAGRKGDPVELQRRFEACCGGDPNGLFERTEHADPLISLPANEQLARAVCTAFKLGDPWDDLKGTGIKEKVWGKVLDDFLGHVRKNVSPADGEPTSSVPSAPESSSSASPSNISSGSIPTAS